MRQTAGLMLRGGGVWCVVCRRIKCNGGEPDRCSHEKDVKVAIAAHKVRYAALQRGKQGGRAADGLQLNLAPARPTYLALFLLSRSVSHSRRAVTGMCACASMSVCVLLM